MGTAKFIPRTSSNKFNRRRDLHTDLLNKTSAAVMEQGSGTWRSVWGTILHHGRSFECATSANIIQLVIRQETVYFDTVERDH